jgi:hypothetical protein
MACIALYTGDDDHVRRTIADKLIALAKTGERNPDVLCDRRIGRHMQAHRRRPPCRTRFALQFFQGASNRNTPSAQSRASAHIGRCRLRACLSWDLPFARDD